MSLTRKTKFEASPLRFFVILIPFVIATILGYFTMGINDTASCIWWAVCLLLFGIVTLPLAIKLWGDFSSGGFFLSQPLGLILTGLILWTLTHLKVFRLDLISIIISALILAACCYIPKSFRQSLIKKVEERGFLESIVIEETAFLVVFFLMCFFKGFFPSINGQEKFMDYGFIMAMLRNDSLPANDMWLSGNPINYYYFGQYLWTLVVKISHLPTGIGYTLAMCSATAIPFGMSFTIGKFLVEAASKRGFIDNRIVKYIAGLFTGCAVSIWGNSHSFFYDENSFGNNILKMFGRMGINIGRTDHFFYPDSTRYIGWNPVVETNGGDYTIEEFPFYSFLVGDLHAHVISMMVVLLISALVLSMISSVKLPSTEEVSVKRTLDNLSSEKLRLIPEFESSITLPVILCAILLGCAQMTNYWDFLIYFVFCSMGLLIINTVRSAVFADWLDAFVFIANVGGILLVYLSAGSNPALMFALEALIMVASFFYCVVSPSALPRTSFQMSFLFTTATLVALPFNMNFDMISNSLGAVKNRSSLFQLFILYGTHVIISVVFLIIVFASKNYELAGSRNKKKTNRSSSSDKAIVIGNKNEFTNPVQAFFSSRNLIDIYVCGMTVVGLMLIIAPEIFYVRDIYTGGYLRSNTMFKFAFGALIILSITMIYSIIRLFWYVNKKGQYNNVLFTVGIAFAFLLFIPSHYTLLGLKQRSGELKRENYKTLDGTAYLDTYDSPYVADRYDGNIADYKICINWFNSYVEGSPVICEAYGDSYSDNCIVSAYTGLPTVFGWQTHEMLWRFHGIVDKNTDTLISDPDNDVSRKFISPRHRDIDTVYLSEDANEVQNIINKYQIEYIIMGNMERYKYGYDNSVIFYEIGTVAFRYDNITVFKVEPQPLTTSTQVQAPAESGNSLG